MQMSSWLAKTAAFLPRKLCLLTPVIFTLTWLLYVYVKQDLIKLNKLSLDNGARKPESATKAAFGSAQTSHVVYESTFSSNIGTSVLPSEINAVMFAQYIAIESIFGKRLLQVRKYCSLSKPDYIENWEKVKNEGKHISGFIGSHPHRALICLVLKAGSSTWNDFFWRIRAPEEWAKYPFWEKAVHGNSGAFKDFDDDRRKEIWQDPNGVRIISVRHPFGRLISGWNDKFTKSYYYNIWFKLYPGLKNYPNKYGKWRGFGRDGHFMEWADFASYVADYGDQFRETLDGHFHPIIATCDPCEYPFNYITKMETLTSEAQWLLQNKFNVSSSMLKNQNQLKTPNYAETIREYFSQLRPDVVERIYKIYEADMLAFGYTFNKTTLEAGGWDD